MLRNENPLAGLYGLVEHGVDLDDSWDNFDLDHGNERS